MNNSESTKRVHLGKLIEKVLKERGMSKAEFGRRIDTSRQNINGMLQKPTLDCASVIKISQVLEVNFFEPFIDQLNFLPDPPSPQTNGQEGITVSLPVYSRAELLALYDMLEASNLIQPK